MASNEHKELSQFLKNVHSSLRELSAKHGSEKAWNMHCGNQEMLNDYAQKMQELATVHWKDNSIENKCNTSRIKWTVDFCYEYFFNKLYIYYRVKEIDIANKINLDNNSYVQSDFYANIKLLDVGSCYNPFKDYEFFNTVAIDLCPANDSVLKCDFLKLEINSNMLIDNNRVVTLAENSFDVVTFCFVLEYLPSSEQRLLACEKAYKLLKHEGIMIITTPDSKHVGANAKLMKCWRYTLACMGFSRIKYEKFEHMHCMSFRKSIHVDVAARWATLHKESYMHVSLNIPQDFQCHLESYNYLPVKNVELDFSELPFSNNIIDEN